MIDKRSRRHITVLVGSGRFNRTLLSVVPSSLCRPGSVFITVLCVALLVLPSGVPPPLATPLEDAVEEMSRGVREGAASQKRISDLDDEARALLDRYREVTRDATALEAYVDRLRQLIADQEVAIDRYRKYLDDIETLERELFPAMQVMIDVLQKLIQADLPFLLDERNARMLRLEKLMRRSDVGISEKFRQLIEAYQVESDYGRTIGTYRGRLDDDTDRVVDFLRVGRSLLAYQTLDGGESGVWNAVAAGWQPLDDSYRNDIRRALRIAAKRSVPDLLVLPFAAPVNLEDLR